MNKLNFPANRLKFYKRLLKVVCEDSRIDVGYCAYLNRAYMKAFGSGAYEAHMNANLTDLPELMYYRPKGKWNIEHWFPCTVKGWEKRIAILEEIISNMKKNLNYYL